MSVPQPGTPRTIYVQWSDDGQHIRKWSMAEFGLAERLIAETMSVSDPKAQAMADALRDYQFAEEIDDEAVRQAELAVSRQNATAVLAAWDAKP